MTIDELKNYRKLRYSIRYWKDQLDTLRKGSYTKSPGLDGLPGSGELSDPTSERAIKEARTEERISRMIAEQESEAERIMEWIGSIEDPVIQVIMHARYIRGLSWTAVAHRIGGGNTAENIRQVHWRYLSHLSHDKS